MNAYLNESNFTMVEEGFTTRDLLENLLVELCQASDQQAFFVADLGDIVKKHLRFLKALPRVKPYFPVKCNGSEGVMRLLAELGAGFACTNKAEIARVQSIGVPADKIFYSSPCKQVAHIKYAASHGVRLMTLDNEVELSKVARSHPDARVLLGIAADSSPSAHPSMMFGTTLKSCRHLLETAKEQAVEVVGISFHLGSCGLDPQAFAQSVAAAQLAFEMGTELGYRMHLLDIGGGFPGTEDTRARFEEIAAVINSALDLYFPDGCGVEIVARPGRYYVTSAFTFAASITAMEEVPAEQPGSDETLPRPPLAQQQPPGPPRTRGGPHCRRPGAARAARRGLADFRGHGCLHRRILVPAWGVFPATDHLRHVPRGLESRPALPGKATANGRRPRQHLRPAVLRLGDGGDALRHPGLRSGQHHLSSSGTGAGGKGPAAAGLRQRLPPRLPPASPHSALTGDPRARTLKYAS
ncbi:antizyme inhibitor 2 isoform X1 [Calonectris borealis]|uniref:antizyme inhibitor 2 isoform X1 n=1 Tax=Calonectris borealis TaxID=1323832 RepID=UPI003F4B0322